MKPKLIVTIATGCDLPADRGEARPRDFVGISQGLAGRLHPLFASFGIQPTYLLSPKVLCHRGAVDILRGLQNCELGVYLDGVESLPTGGQAKSQRDSSVTASSSMAMFTELFKQQFDRSPVSFRAENVELAHNFGTVLTSLGYLVDSSIIPSIGRAASSENGPTEATDALDWPYFVASDGNLWKPGKSNLLEVPVTVLAPGSVSAKNTTEPIWLRPGYSDADTLRRIIDQILEAPERDGRCRPLVLTACNLDAVASLRTEKEVQRFLDQLKTAFHHAADRGVESCTLQGYYNQLSSKSPGVSMPHQSPAPIELRSSFGSVAPELTLNPRWLADMVQAHPLPTDAVSSDAQRLQRWELVRPTSWILDAASKDSRLLFTGCGIGLTPLWFAQHGFKHLTARDPSPAAIEIAKAAAKQIGAQVDFAVDEPLRPRTLHNESYDVIVALDWIHAVEGFSLDRFFALYLPLLSQEGALIIDFIDSRYGEVEGNRFHTCDLLKPEGERRPSEFRNRFSEKQIQSALNRHGLTAGICFSEPQRVPRKVFVCRRTPVTTPAARVPIPSANRPRIMLMADVPNWIFARHCKVLKDLLGSEFEFDLKFQGQSYDESDYDLIYPLEWNLIPVEQIKSPAKYVTSIRSHTSWEAHDFLNFADLLAQRFQRVHAVSRRLTDLFSPFVPNLSYITHGTDTAFFTPSTRADRSGAGKVRVGWAGNRVNKTKGFEQFIAPLQQIPGVELVFCGYMDKHLDMEGMRRFYDSIDVYICSSQKEGNNNSLMEAAAMERAIITTDNGTVPEYLENGRSALIIERETPAFIHAVCRLRDDPEFRVTLGRNARQAVCEMFEWIKMSQLYAQFFRHALGEVHQWKPQPGGGSRSVESHFIPATRRVPTPPPNPASEAAAAALFNQVGAPEPDPLAVAEAQVRKALSIDPNGADALRLLAQILFQQNRWLESAKVCQQVLGIVPGDRDVMVVLAESLVRLDDLPTAAAVYGELLKLHPEDKDVQQRLNELAPPAEEPALTAEQEACIQEGMQALEKEDFRGALDHYRKAQSMGSKHAMLDGLVQQLEAAVAASADAQADALPANTSPVPVPPSAPAKPREPGWSFLIITNGKRPTKLHREIASIKALNIPTFEILVSGEPPEGLPEDVGIIRAEDAARNGRLGEMRNLLTRQARFDHLVVVDDDFIFHEDFYQGLLRFGDDWEALCVRILNPDGTRFWDWATHGGPRGHVLLNYDETDEHIYITGGLALLKAHVADKVQWDDVRGFYQGEDLDFSSRLRAAGIRPKFNRQSTTTHDDGHYTIEPTGSGIQIQRRESELSLPIRWAAPFFNPSGYASEAINFVVPLEARCNLGIRHDNSLTSENFIAGLPESERSALLRMKQRFPSLRAGIHISHNPAGGFKREPDADYSVGRSMFETDRIPAEWVASCNRMDEVWVPSKFNVETFANSGVERSKLVVIPGAVDPAVFDPQAHVPYALYPRAGYNFLSIFEWSSRKGWDVMLAAYFREFSASDDVCLWLRTYLFSKPDGDPAEAIRQHIAAFTATLGLGDKPLPRVEIIAQQVPSAQLPALYLACDCYLAPSRGEGWGRPQHEAMLMERPVIATNWSANTEFMTDENSYLLDYELVEARELEPELWHYKGHRWANPSETHLRSLLRHVFSNRDEARAKGIKARKHMAANYSREAVADLVLRRLQQVERGLRSPRLPKAPVQTVHKPGPTSGIKPVAVALEGSFLDFGSLSGVNRALIQAASQQPGIRMTAVSTEDSPAKTAPAELKQFANRISKRAPNDTTITLRHEWPPRWSAPKSGAWILMQPWEFGSIPADWVAHARDVDEIWCYSNYVRSLYLAAGVPTEKLRILPLGFDPKLHRPDAPPTALATTKRFKFLFVGGTIGRKGADVLLETFLKTFKRSDDVCLVIKDFGGRSVYAGQTLLEDIRKAQADPNAPEILHLDQELSSTDLAGLYTACDCLVHPYRGEGFGLPVLEAMASALPVIVTGGGSTDDFATDEFVHRLPARIAFLGNEISGMTLDHRGWWLEPDADHLRWALLDAVQNQTSWKERAHRGAAHVATHWTWQRTAETAAALVQDFQARRQARHAPAAGAKSVSLTLPPAALLGRLKEAESFVQANNLSAAWASACGAIQERPFNPPAWTLLADIAHRAKDLDLARSCAQNALALAPSWKPAKKLVSELRGKQTVNRFSQPLPEFRDSNHQELSVCLITKNEERFLGQCLASVQALHPQIVVVDTGSTDQTVDIAKRFGAEVYQHVWNDDFSAARNEALRHAKGDWILMLDADEVLTPEALASLPKEMARAGLLAYRLPIVDHGREESGRSFVPRLFRNAPGLFYVGRIHEQIYSSLEVRRQEWSMENGFAASQLLHYGYTPEMMRDRNKIARNLKLLERAIEEYPGDPNLLMNLGLELTKSGQLAHGVNYYLDALDAMHALSAEHWVPELRETLLTQLSTHLLNQMRFKEIPLLFKTRLAAHAALTASMHFTLGLAHMELKQPKEAVEQFRACLAKRNEAGLCPVNPEIRKAGPAHCLAMCLISLNKELDAERAFQQAMKDAPEATAVRFDYARFQMHCKQPVEALKTLHGLVTEKPKDVKSWAFGAEVTLSQPEFAEVALDWTTAAVDANPGDANLVAMKAEALLLHQRAADCMNVLLSVRDPRNLKQAAMIVLCQLTLGHPLHPLTGLDETAVSKEFVNWFRRLVNSGAGDLVQNLLQNVNRLETVLPSASAALREVMGAANQMQV